MKKTAIATMIMTLVVIGTTWAQPNRRASSQVGNPFGLGGTVTAGVKNRQPATFRKRIDKSSPAFNGGDTATHEVGHKQANSGANQRMNPGTRQPSYLKIEGIDGESLKNRKTNAAKYDGIDGESNDARMRQPHASKFHW